MPSSVGIVPPIPEPHVYKWVPDQLPSQRLPSVMVGWPLYLLVPEKVQSGVRRDGEGGSGEGGGGEGGSGGGGA